VLKAKEAVVYIAELFIHTLALPLITGDGLGYTLTIAASVLLQPFSVVVRV
jgi:hypothetical protein